MVHLKETIHKNKVKNPLRCAPLPWPPVLVPLTPPSQILVVCSFDFVVLTVAFIAVVIFGKLANDGVEEVGLLLRRHQPIGDVLLCHLQFGTHPQLLVDPRTWEGGGRRLILLLWVDWRLICCWCDGTRRMRVAPQYLNSPTVLREPINLHVPPSKNRTDWICFVLIFFYILL